MMGLLIGEHRGCCHRCEPDECVDCWFEKLGALRRRTAAAFRTLLETGSASRGAAVVFDQDFVREVANILVAQDVAIQDLRAFAESNARAPKEEKYVPKWHDLDEIGKRKEEK